MNTSIEDIAPYLGSGTAGAAIISIFSYLKARLSTGVTKDAQDWDQMLKLVETLQNIIVTEREQQRKAMEYEREQNRKMLEFKQKMHDAEIEALKSRIQYLESLVIPHEGGGI